MQPDIDVLGLSIKTFGVCFAFGFLAAGAVVSRRLKELGKPVDWAYEIVFSSLVGGLVGARLYFLVQHPNDFKDDPLGSLFGGTGLVWYGGAIGVLLWAWRRKFLSLAMFDLCCVPLALGYAIGRVGCQISGDGDYGRATDLPWGMAYPKGTVPTTQDVHPTPIYETITMGLLTWVLWRYRDRVRPGVLFGWYLIGGGLERFLVEFVRRNHDTAIGLTGPQIESLTLVVGGLIWLEVLRRRGGWSPAPATA